MTHIVVVGGGPAGYEAALVAAQLEAQVTLVDSDGVGGACVLTDCVPSKTLVARSAVPDAGADAPRLFTDIVHLAQAQSDDIAQHLDGVGITRLAGQARFVGDRRLAVFLTGGGVTTLAADVILLATGATPRVLETARPDGRRILTWRDLYRLPALPEHLVVVGSGVTGAEFASAFRALGSEVTLVSSRDRVLPGEDPDAAAVIEDVFARRGIRVIGRARASAVAATADGVQVDLEDGRVVEGSHALMAVGSVPRTADLDPAAGGVGVTDGGFIQVDRVSRTTAPGVYAAGDCTGVLMLASVAAMQGRIAMWHALGEAVTPLSLHTVSANVFTDPEIATVGVTAAQIGAGTVTASEIKLPLATNARAKMQTITDGFVKLFSRPGSGTVLGGVVVAPHASELILPLSLAVHNGLTVDQVAHTFAIYPSLSGSLTEAARQLMARAAD